MVLLKNAIKHTGQKILQTAPWGLHYVVRTRSFRTIEKMYIDQEWYLSRQAQVPICGWLMAIPWCVTLSGCRGWLLRCSNYFLYGDLGLFRIFPKELGMFHSLKKLELLVELDIDLSIWYNTLLFECMWFTTVVLECYRRCPDSHDPSECHHLYDLGRHISLL